MISPRNQCQLNELLLPVHLVPLAHDGLYLFVEAYFRLMIDHIVQDVVYKQVTYSGTDGGVVYNTTSLLKAYSKGDVTSFGQIRWI